MKSCKVEPEKEKSIPEMVDEVTREELRKQPGGLMADGV